MKKKTAPKTETTDPKPDTPAVIVAAPDRPDVPERLERIPLVNLRPTSNNPRIINPKDPKIAELAASIKANGLLQPGVARPTKSGTYELLAGARRYEAHRILGCPDMLCIVLDLDDRAAAEVTCLENLQRSDLTPFEEARGVQSLLDTGHSTAEIAADLGKSTQWVARRAQLTKLHTDARNELEMHHSTIGHMLALSVLPRSVQAAVAIDNRVKYLFDPDRLRDFIEHLNELQQVLDKAPFPIDRQLIPRAPTCLECQRRSGVNPDLFGDDQQPGKEDRCLDIECWKSKTTFWKSAELERIKAEYPNVIMVRTEYSYDRELAKLPDVEKADKYNTSDYVFAKQKTPGAVPAFVVLGSQEGKVIWVVKNKTQEATSSKKPARETGADGKAVPPKPEERQKSLHLKRLAWMVNTFTETVAGNMGDLFGAMSHSKALAILLAFGSSVNNSDPYRRDSTWEDWEANGKDKGPDAATLEACYDNHLARLFQLRVRYTTIETAAAAYEDAARICRLFDYPLFARHYEAAMKDLPVPKSWGKSIADPWEKRIRNPFDEANDRA